MPLKNQNWRKNNIHLLTLIHKLKNEVRAEIAKKHNPKPLAVNPNRKSIKRENKMAGINNFK